MDSTTLDHCICGIGFLLSECLKHNVNPFDFSSSIEEAQLSEEAKQRRQLRALIHEGVGNRDMS